MPRGRPRKTATPGSTAASNSIPATGRLTRSASIRNLAEAPSPGLPFEITKTQDSPSAVIKRGRGRPRKSLATNEPSLTTPDTLALDTAPPVRRQGRSTRASALSSVSISSAPTPQEGLSESNYSTPATSKVPTPTAADAGKPSLSFEVRVPGPARPTGNDKERGLRNSLYSMKPSRENRVIKDSEDDDDGIFSDDDRDSKFARRLQEAEFASGASNLSLTCQKPAPRLSLTHHDKPAQISQGISLSKRKVLLDSDDEINELSGRPGFSLAKQASAPPSHAPKSAGTRVASNTRRATKKAKVVPDSDIDMDAELAAAAAAARAELSDSFEDYDPFANHIPSDFDSRASVSSDEEDTQPVKRRKPPFGPNTLVDPPRNTGTGLSRSEREEQYWAEELEEIDAILQELDENEFSTDSLAALSDSSIDSVERRATLRRVANERRAYRATGTTRREKKERARLERNHPEITTMWKDLENMPILKAGKAPQPTAISRQLKPFQLEGLAWLMGMEKTEWKGGLLGDEMGLGKTIQAVSLIMSDFPAKQPSLVLVPPVALMQWQQEIKSYTDGTLKTFVYHGTNQKTKGITVKDLKKYDVIMMSYNSLESIYRKQEKGFKRKDGFHKERSVIHSIDFHRVILDEAHCIKTRSTMTAKACFALKTTYRWCLSGTPLQNRIGEFFSLIRFLNIRPFASYLCKQCPCSTLEWSMNEDSRCSQCNHAGMQHCSVFNQELLNPIQKFGNLGPGKEAFRKLRLMTDRIMLRRLKKDHTNAMELPVKEIYVDRQFFGEEENDFANSIMTNGQRKFDTYVAQGVLLNNYANIFGLIMQMRQVADHPDLLLKKNSEGGQNVLVCCICDEPAEDTVRSRCKHDFCRACISSYVHSTDKPDCPRCHILLAVDLEQPEIEQDEALVKKNSIINRIKMENWTSSSKIELLVHELHKLRSDNASHKSIIFSQFTTMLQLIEWRLRRAGITTVMLDGSMTPAQRQASIEHFMTNVNVECFLVSLKAGGVALNLTEASRVYIVDPWWNPAAEWQSADRCHRIGQTRPCTITRLCIEDSVESRMVLIQEKKTSMIHSTVNADDKAMESLSPQDMQFLFRGT